jgi:hypothetical protein
MNLFSEINGLERGTRHVANCCCFVYWIIKTIFIPYNVFLKLINVPYGYEDLVFNGNVEI